MEEIVWGSVFGFAFESAFESWSAVGFRLRVSDENSERLRLEGMPWWSSMVMVDLVCRR